MDIRILQAEKQACEKKIHDALMYLLSYKSISFVAVDVEIITYEKQSGEKIFKVKPLITLGI